ncbi:MAG: zinc-binding dehydrogenase [Armatimonadetes bacterium]|nr:zinc-binding dehydrogenase [Armatimonadota bacterium]
MKTPAVVFTDVAQNEVREIEMPPPGPGEVQIRTSYSTISAGTEGWALRQLFTWARTPYPCVPGYQRVGIITELGPDVEGWQVGDRVMATVGRWEGEVVSFWGSHAAVANTVASELYWVPDGADEVDASGTVVAQVGYNAASRVAMEPGDWGLVYGDGLIGQCAAQAAQARGANVILVGHRPERLELARQYSAELAVNNATESVAEVVREHAGGQVAFVIDTVQQEAAQQEYSPLLEHGKGQIVYSGFTPAETWASMADLQKRELTTHYVSGWTRAKMDATLALMAEGQMRLLPLATHQVDAVARGAEMYRMILEKGEPFLGIVLDWTKA